MDRVQEKKVIEMTTSALQKALGERPQGWRTPDFAVSENTLPLLSDMGYVWDSSLLNDDFTPSARAKALNCRPLIGFSPGSANSRDFGLPDVVT